MDQAEVRANLQSIVEGRVSPDRGAAGLWSRLADAPDEYPADLRIFVGLISEWQDHPAQRQQLEADIREEAQRWLDAHPSD